MTLTFPNRSRSYDEARHGVRFIGYDGMFEVPFLVEAAALQEKSASAVSEASCLAAFDASRFHFQDVAREVYAN
jgi:hypothetical protein